MVLDYIFTSWLYLWLYDYMIFSHPPKKPTKTGKKATVGGPTASWYFPRDMKAVVGRGVKSRVSLRYIQKFNRMTRRSVSLHQAQNAAGTSKRENGKTHKYYIPSLYYYTKIQRDRSPNGWMWRKRRMLCFSFSHSSIKAPENITNLQLSPSSMSQSL